MSSNPAMNAFENAQNWSDAARLHVAEARKKSGKDEDVLEVLEDLAVAIGWLAIGMQKTAK